MWRFGTVASIAMNDSSGSPAALAQLPVPLDRDLFLRKLIRHLSGALQDVVGLEEAAGFVSIVGQRMGDEIGRASCRERV